MPSAVFRLVAGAYIPAGSTSGSGGLVGVTPTAASIKPVVERYDPRCLVGLGARLLRSEGVPLQAIFRGQPHGTVFGDRGHERLRLKRGDDCGIRRLLTWISGR